MMTLRPDYRLTQRVMDRHTQHITCSTRCLAHTPGFTISGQSGESLNSPLVAPRSAIKQILKRERRRLLRDDAFLPSHGPKPACRGAAHRFDGRCAID